MTLLPLMAQAVARLAATKVLPSPGSGLVTTTMGHGVSSKMTRRLVRSSRIAFGDLGLGRLDQRDGHLARPDLAVARAARPGSAPR